MRAVVPEDDALFRAFFDRVTVQDLTLRFFAPVKHIGRAFIERLTRFDPAHAFALVAIETGSGDMLGAVRLHADLDGRAGEFAILVRSDLKGHGLGSLLMTLMIEAARERGVASIEGQVLRENVQMLALSRELGFTIRPDPQSAEIALVSLALT